MTLTFDLESQRDSRFSRYMFTQNFIKLTAAVHELSCPQTYLLYLAMVKNPKIRSSDLDL